MYSTHNFFGQSLKRPLYSYSKKVEQNEIASYVCQKKCHHVLSLLYIIYAGKGEKKSKQMTLL